MGTLTHSKVLNIHQIREQFPILHQQVNGKPLIYFDNAATTQKPQRVIDALVAYYSGYNANIHRGIHTLAEKATKAFEQTRDTAQRFLGARHREEIIFTSGVTDGINLVAFSYAWNFLQSGDDVIISGLEHHSNLVPWQLACEARNAVLRIIPFSSTGEVSMAEFKKLLSSKTKIVAINHASNSLGTVNPIRNIIDLAHDAGAVVLIDGAQAVAHLEIDVQQLDCDFYCLSAHKMYGPTGVGVLYGKKELLEKMPPYRSGGEMIRHVTYDHTTFNDLPYKFEAGTPNIADVIAFREAIDFIDEIGKPAMAAYEDELLEYASQRLASLPYVRLIGTAEKKVSVQSFVIEGIHPFDVGQMLDARGIAVRTGHHCTEPLMNMLCIEGTVRASFAIYNTKEEIDSMIDSLDRIIKFLKP